MAIHPDARVPFGNCYHAAMRRHPWLTAAILFVVIGAVVFFCFEWHSEMRWERYAADARKRGVKLNLAEFAGPEIPDEQNFAALPMMRKVFVDGDVEPSFALPQLTSEQPKYRRRRSSPWEGYSSFGDPFKQQPIDWVEWQKFFQSSGLLPNPTDRPVDDVLRALEHYAPEIGEWRQWRVRPQCRFPLDATKGARLPWPCIRMFRYATTVFTLRMRAHLAGGDSAAAYADFQDGLQVYRALKDYPSVVAGLVRIALLRVLLGGVGDGLKDHAWSDTECRKIQTDLGAIRVWDDCALALSSERGGVNTMVETWMNKPLRERGELLLGGYGSNADRYAASLIPRGWMRDSQWRYNRYFDELLARVDTAKQTFNPDGQTPSSPMNLSGNIDKYHYLIFYFSGESYDRLGQRYAAVATFLDEARLALALEQFRARHQAYPESLTELIPEFIASLPIDIYGRAPYRYQRLGKDAFRLYGVGPNRTDEGGQLVPGVYETLQLDAVWPYALPAAKGSDPTGH